MKKIFSCFLILITLLNLTTVPAFASSPTTPQEETVVMVVEPRFSNVISTHTAFAITDTGLCEASVIYTGIQGVTTKVTSTIYLQKKTLGLFWTKVDIGTTNDKWVDSSTDISDRFAHQFQLKSTGTYRAVFVITVSGTGGSDDVVEDKIQNKYS